MISATVHDAWREPTRCRDHAPAEDSIRFTFEEIESGGRVRITTADPEALMSVHEFVRYQITEHRTGDPLTIQK